MKTLQVTTRVLKYRDDISGLIEYVSRELTRQFYEEVDKHLAETPGGIILSPPRLVRRDENDWRFKTGDYITFTLSATCEDLPLPPEYRLIGGPADGCIVRTLGQRYWYVPVAPPPPSMASYADPLAEVPLRFAEYERQGDTAAYLYKRMDPA